jgi:hypothetical protein
MILTVAGKLSAILGTILFYELRVGDHSESVAEAGVRQSNSRVTLLAQRAAQVVAILRV